MRRPVVTDAQSEARKVKLPVHACSRTLTLAEALRLPRHTGGPCQTDRETHKSRWPCPEPFALPLAAPPKKLRTWIREREAGLPPTRSSPGPLKPGAQVASRRRSELPGRGPEAFNNNRVICVSHETSLKNGLGRGASFVRHPVWPETSLRNCLGGFQASGQGRAF